MFNVLPRLGTFLLLLVLFTHNTTSQSVWGGPNSSPLPPQPILYNGQCRLCEIDCLAIAPYLFSSCTWRYYRYGCDARFFCLATTDMRYSEKYVAVTYCMAEAGCQLNPWVNSVQALESYLNIPYYLSFTQYAMTSPTTVNPQWLNFIANRNAIYTAAIYNVIRDHPGDNPTDQAIRLTKLRPLFFSYIHPGPGPLIRFKQALDIYDMRYDRNLISNYVQRWANALPSWMANTLYPITTMAEAEGIMADTDWQLKPLDQYLYHRTPEFVFYSFAVMKLQQYEQELASKFRTYKECNYWGPNMQYYCYSFNFNQWCDYYAMRRYCQSVLDNLEIDGKIDDSRIFIGSVYIGRQLAQSFHSAARRQELIGFETDIRNQLGQSGNIMRTTRALLPQLLVPSTPNY